MGTDLPPPLLIDPPLLNSANPWASTREDLQALFDSPCTGAVTTRTATVAGFEHDSARHRCVFFDGKTHGVSSGSEGAGEKGSASLNNLGYSPIALDGYLGFIEEIVAGRAAGETRKGFVVSVAGTPDEVAVCYTRIRGLAGRLGGGGVLAMEVNLSCPNIPNSPPPAYEAGGLQACVRAVARAGAREAGEGVRVPWGVKIPPYTHAGQFDMLMDVLRGTEGGVCPVSFVTATNTLGSCLVLEEGEDGKNRPALGGSGIGGMAGAPLHPLALGNVATLRRMLDSHPETSHVQIIGVGGVEDAAGYRRMRDVGAAAVGVGTALGRKGVRVFGEIEDGLRKLSKDKVVW
ncbi:hypothetical protein F5Y11DRAFT_365556 [Daldinia sp. FL1419]|nr:hypothetical protein F5Y11DRAFT_365556 [Daldinia sp. FL1419]